MKGEFKMSVFSFIMSIFMFFASLFLPKVPQPAVPEITDDGFVPVMRFVATSDTHINTMGDEGCERLTKLIRSAYAISDADNDYKELDAMVFSGDITDNGFIGSFASFAAVTDSELREGTERLGVVSKNHDSYTFLNNSLKIYTAFTGQETDFHRVINGFHFIGVSRSATLKQYTDEQVKWLDENLAAAVAESPEKPVFVFQHEHVIDTVYGSSKEDGWGMDTFRAVLEKYPQAIHISGHSHFPANDPRAIWQDSFTAINDGGLAYFELAIDGKNGQFPEGYKSMTQALVVEVDAENRVLVRVLDVDKGVFVKEFLIDNVTQENKQKYNPEYRKQLAEAPFFEEGAELSVERNRKKLTVSLPQAKVEGDNEVFAYRIEVTDASGKTVHSSFVFSEYYFAERCETVKFDDFRLTGKGKYTVNVVAEDVWGNRSEALVTDIEI